MTGWKPTNWKDLAAALDPPIPPEDVDKIVPVLDAMEARFRPLQQAIPLGSDPWTGPEDLQ